MMNIVHVVEGFDTGVLEFIYGLTSELTDHRHWVVYSVRKTGDLDKGKRTRFGEHVTLVEWPQARREIGLHDFKAMMELRRMLRKIGSYDALHLHSSKAGFLGRALLTFSAGKNVIYTPNGAAFTRLDIAGWKKNVYGTLERIADTLSGRVICSSASESKAYRRYGVKSGYINNGTKVGDKPYGHDEPRQDGQPFTVVTVGGLRFQKNPDLFSAIAEHFRGDKGIRFVWVGDGEDRPKLEGTNVDLTGWISSEEVYAHLRQADLYLSTALWEGLPFAVMEAMAHGLPLVLKSCVGNVDLVREGKNGHLFEEAEEAIVHIQKLREQPETLRVFGERSFRMCQEEFNVAKMAKEYEALYAQKKRQLASAV